MTWIFRSIKFNVALFLLIAVLAALGTFIPQITDNADKVAALANNHPYWAEGLSVIGFFDLYHTFFFAGLLALMAVDVVLCKLWNKPPDHGLVRSVREASDDDVTLRALHQKPFRLEGSIVGSMEAAAKQFSDRFKRSHYTVRRVALPENGIAIVGSRHRAQRWGSYVSHIAIVVILLGATFRSLFGFETFLPVLEGRSARVTQPLINELTDDPPLDPHAPLYVRGLHFFTWPHRIKNKLLHLSIDRLANWELFVDKLTVDFYYHSTTPSTFSSHVRVMDGFTTLADSMIRVNQPLDISHIRFYQASWGVTGMVGNVVLKAGDKTYPLTMQQSFPIPGEPWTGRIEGYMPNFTIGADGEPTTANLEWKNPALLIGIYNDESKKIATLAMEAPTPNLPPDPQPWAIFFIQGSHIPTRAPFQIISAQPMLFSGIQINYDPGFPIVVGGVLSMLGGLMALFYLHQRRVMVFLRPQAGDIRLDIGGWSSRGPREFRGEFAKLFADLSLQPVQAMDDE